LVCGDAVFEGFVLEGDGGEFVHADLGLRRRLA
jgi:hypothetical protein